jgi:hypothetical protein
MATASLEHPEECVKNVIYPVVSPSTLQNLVKEFKSSGPTYRERVYTVMRASYLHHYRRMVPQILNVLEFRSNNELYQPVIRALELIKKYTGSTQHYYSQEDEVLIDGVLKNTWRDIVVEVDAAGAERINRVNYEISVLQALRDQLRSKEIWVVGARTLWKSRRRPPKRLRGTATGLLSSTVSTHRWGSFHCQLTAKDDKSLRGVRPPVVQEFPSKDSHKRQWLDFSVPSRSSTRTVKFTAAQSGVDFSLAYDQFIRCSQRN